MQHTDLETSELRCIVEGEQNGHILSCVVWFSVVLLRPGKTEIKAWCEEERSVLERRQDAQ